MMSMHTFRRFSSTFAHAPPLECMMLAHSIPTCSAHLRPDSIFHLRARANSHRSFQQQRLPQIRCCSCSASPDEASTSCSQQQAGQDLTSSSNGHVRQWLQRAGPFLHRAVLGDPWRQGGGRLGQALTLAAVLVMPQLNGHGWGDLFTRNYVFKSGFWAWLLAQTMKIFTKRVKKGVWDLKAIVDSGGMPSSHSALCTAVTTAVGLEFGLASSLFAVALCFTLVTMYDAAGVRYHSGKQAEVLNILLEDVIQGHPVTEQRLKEVLGHTPLQVIAGAILGVLIGLFTPVPSAVVL